jgi:hypothetical protein
MKNQVIEVLNEEHGKKVIEYWKSKGVDTKGLVGDCTKESFLGSELRFYGVIDGEFNNYTEENASYFNAEIIELPEEKPFPRVMLVSDDGDAWNKRVVFMKRCNRYLSWLKAETIEESEGVYEATAWRYAKEVESKPRTITISDLNSKIEDIKKLFGIDNEDVIIKID